MTAEPRLAQAWHEMSPDAVVAQLGTSASGGLSSARHAELLAIHGPNDIGREKEASWVVVALNQFRDPMTAMLVVVAIVSFFIAQASTAWVVLSLVAVNVVLGTNQELKAQASVSALASLQVLTANVVRDGAPASVPAASLVPGDVVALEAGDLVPADGRLVSAASMETQESALTGESTPVDKGVRPIPGGEVALGDRHSMVYKNTSVTRGSGTFVVTATGMETEVGRIAGMLVSVKATKSPLQIQLSDLTGKIGWIAWGALAVILAVGLVRGMPFADLMLLGVSMAISAIPTGMPTFVQSMLAVGARELADAKAIVRNLTDVETLGSTTHINTDKTGTLTLNEMTARRLYAAGHWFDITGHGYETAGEIRGAAGAPRLDLTALAYVGALASDASLTEEGTVGDPTELAVVVLAEKLGVSVPITRKSYPRVATVPFDSDYKFMATFHRLPFDGRPRLVGLVKGGPDIVMDRCRAVWMGDQEPVAMSEARQDLEQANHDLASAGLRVLALAVRVLPEEDEADLKSDPMPFAQDLLLVGLVGIIDPLRPEAVQAVKTAKAAGIDVRIITGDHLATASAIGEQLGLGRGGLTGVEMNALNDDELAERLPQLHVFGRVSPQDKLRLVDVMQRKGMIVAMTGDAVNDAAALKQANIGVAMGSGSEVSKQAAKMILTDDNFATLVAAVALGRSVFSKITAYISYQMTQLFSLVVLFLLATAFNINQGVAMLPLQVLFLNFVIAVIPVIVISLNPPDPDVMNQTPRDPDQRIMDRSAIIRWVSFGTLLALMCLGVIVATPGPAAIDGASAPITMGFVMMGLGTAVTGFALHRSPRSSLARPVLRPALINLIALPVMFLTTEVGFLQRWLGTVPLSDSQWGLCLALTLAFGAAIELDKYLQRRSLAVAPANRVPGRGHS